MQNHRIQPSEGSFWSEKTKWCETWRYLVTPNAGWPLISPFLKAESEPRSWLSSQRTNGSSSSSKTQFFNCSSSSELIRLEPPLLSPMQKDYFWGHEIFTSVWNFLNFWGKNFFLNFLWIFLSFTGLLYILDHFKQKKISNFFITNSPCLFVDFG